MKLIQVAFDTNSKADREAGRLYSEQKGFSYILSKGCWHGKDGGRMTQNGASYVIVRECIWPSG